EVSPRLEVVDTFIFGQNKRIEMKREEIRRLKQLEEEKYDIWQEKRKDKKSLELLKERKFEEYKKEVMKKQAKDLDDMITTRFKLQLEDENG
ncbi:MAG: flagellar FliJ family protein, partial [Bdellovibrionales bacterium]|nr:flagellar FliJ family protein [Bdellovibrionales bacterium]